MSSETAALATFASNLTYAEIPPEVQHQTVRVIYDTVICMLAARGVTSIERFQRGLARIGGPGELPATLVHDGSLASPANAAFLNALSANTLDLDDNLLYHSHIAATVVATCIATAEERNATGAELITAVAAAYEVAARVSLSMTGPVVVAESEGKKMPQFQDPYGHGFNAIGAGAGAANLRRLGVAQTAATIGMCAYATPVPSMAKATLSATLYDAKVGMYGWQAWSAFTSAVFVEAGATADVEALDGPSGYWRMAGSPVFHPGLLTGELGQQWWITQTSLLVDPAGTWMRPAVLAVRKALAERTSNDPIDSLVVRLWRLRKSGVFVRRAAQDRLDTMVSYYYLLAMAALDVAPERWQDPATIARPDVQRLLERIEIVDDPAAEEQLIAQLEVSPYRARRVASHVTLTTGDQTLTASSDLGEGDPFSPETALADADLDLKCERFAGHTRPAAAAGLQTAIWKLADLRVRDFTELLRARDSVAEGFRP